MTPAEVAQALNRRSELDGTEVLEIEEGDVVEDDDLHLDVVAQVAEIGITDQGLLSVRFRVLDQAGHRQVETPPYASGDDPRYGGAGN